MEINLTTPALLFSAISLIMLAYTNRFLALANLVRTLHSQYQQQPDEKIKGQINNLRKRLKLIRSMQIYGVTSLFLCVVCMFLIYVGELRVAEYMFGLGLLLLIISLGLSIWEIQISVHALNIHLTDVEEGNK